MEPFALHSGCGATPRIIRDCKYQSKAFCPFSITVMPASVQAETETDASGQYQFRRIPAGTYTLSFEKGTYETISDVEIQVTKGEETSVSNQEMKSMSGDLSGFVFLTDGTPVSNASVLLRKRSRYFDLYSTDR